MGRLIRRLWTNVGFLTWFAFILPTSCVFLVASFVVRGMVRQTLDEVLRASGVTQTSAFDAAFDGRYIVLGAAVAMLISTLITHLMFRAGLQPLRALSRLAREIARGNYVVRANPSPLASELAQTLSTDFNALAESLERTDRLRRELVSNLAHEIRTPLTNLQGYLEALRDGVIPANHDALASVHEEVMRLVRLVDALHQLARADALRHQLPRREMTHLDALAEQMIRVIRAAPEARGIQILVDLGASNISVPIHADSIAQVLRNLLRNAVQYTDSGGTIRIQTAITGDIYTFSCINSGAGIPEEDLPFVFQRFYRTERAKQATQGGVGLGLAIAKELVEAHGGRIGADSKDGWTSFWFDLPLDPAQQLVV